MKRVTTYGLALLTILFLACSPDKKTEETRQQPDPTIPTLNTNQAGSANAAGVQHYVCPNNCPGSGGSVAGVCPTCGSEYQHNALYHSTNNTGQAQPTPDYSRYDKSPLFKDAQPSQSQSTIETRVNADGSTGVQHYICPNGCAGSGGDASGVCPVCGTQYEHNQAYHATNQNNTGADQIQTTSSAQNAAGEYHYICSNGCPGGAAASGTCAQCGAALSHNSAYHQ